MSADGPLYFFISSPPRPALNTAFVHFGSLRVLKGSRHVFARVAVIIKGILQLYFITTARSANANVHFCARQKDSHVYI